MDDTDFSRVMRWLAALYPRYELQPATIEAYYMVLADLHPQALQAAARAWGATEPWFPKASELRGLALDITKTATGEPPLLDAPQAWGLVVKGLRQFGTGGTPDLPPLVWKAIEAIGGWRSLCMMPENLLGLAGDRFAKAYEPLRHTADRAARLPADVGDDVARLTKALAPPPPEEPGGGFEEAREQFREALYASGGPLRGQEGQDDEADRTAD